MRTRFTVELKAAGATPDAHCYFDIDYNVAMQFTIGFYNTLVISGG